MNTKISIIIATYNSGKTLDFALESVIKQEFKNWECIVIDGKSTDNTIEIIKKYECIDNRFSHISETDNGIYDAFNKGWKLACGEWVYYLGSDDRLTKNSFSELLKEDYPNIGVITGDVWIEKIDGTIKANLSKGFEGCHQGKIVRKSIIAQMGGFDEQYRILADLDLMIRMKKRGIGLLNIRSFVAYFVMDGASQKINGEIKRFKERLKIYKTNNVSKFPFIKCLHIHTRNILSILYRYFKKILKNRLSIMVFSR